MILQYFTEEAANELRNFLSGNEDKYYSDEPWLDEFFRSVNINAPYQQPSVTVPDVTLASGAETPEELCAEDLQNVMLLYGAYKDKLTPAQASEPRLWTTLCHKTFNDYVLERWSGRDGKVDLEKRFFATSGRASLCRENALSKLWWAGYLSYDETRESTDPWHLTKTLLSAQKVHTDFIEHDYSASKRVQMGVLSALKRIQEEAGGKATSAFRKCCVSFLNRRAAVTAIDVLEADEIEELAYTYMKSQL